MIYKAIITFFLTLLLGLGNTYSQKHPELELYDDILDLNKIIIQEFTIRESQVGEKNEMIEERLSKMEKSFENGKLVKEVNDNGYWIDSIAYHYDKKLLVKAEYYQLNSKTSYKYRWRQFFFNKGQIFAENIFKGPREIETTTYYKHIKDDSGSWVIKGQKINHRKPSQSSSIYIEYDNQENLIESTEFIGEDTIESNKLIEIRSNHDLVYRYIYNGPKNYNYKYEFKRNSNQKVDNNQLPIEYFSNSMGFYGHKDIMESGKTIKEIENHYTNGIVTGKLTEFQNKRIYGEFYNNRYNVNLVLGLDGTCLVKQFDNSLDNLNKKNVVDSWSQISEQKSCTYDVGKSTISFSGSLTEEIRVYLLYDYLILEKSKSERRNYNSKIYLKSK